MLRWLAKPRRLLHHRVVPSSCQSSSLPSTPGRVSPLALHRRLRCLLQHQRESRRVKWMPRRVAAPSEADAKLSAMLLRAAKEIGLEVPKTPPANPSRLDDWFLGRAPRAPLRSPQCLSSRRCTRSWAYYAAGQAATALHAMATLQVYQAQALKHLHEGGPDQGVMQELCAATDFTLRATKVTACSLGQMARFLNAPISQGGLFGDTIEDFAQQFSAVQKQTEAIKHILPHRDSATTSSGPQRLASSEVDIASAGTREEDFSQGRFSFWDQLPHRGPVGQRSLDSPGDQDWFAAIDLKDTYLHVSIIPRQRPFLRFAFEGRAYQYKVLPFGLSLSLRKSRKLPCSPSGGWAFAFSTISTTQDLLCEHRDLVLRHLSHLGLQVNREKSELSPVQRISFLGVELDSVNMTAHLTNERVQSVLKCLESFRHKTAVPLKTFQRLLGHMAAVAAVTPLGLLHVRPLQRWLHDQVPRWEWYCGTLRIGISLQCRCLFSPWLDPAFLQAGVPLGQVSRHLVVYTDASSTGWGAVCNGQAASGSWTGP
ncbi:hypothetical protein M9458_057972 [Cirrhinus mrigala]|uniref:Uncharacterized protein n=1 Tax=Cirrhinus mrigala TaxID=683832 RepID=A0ABD0MCI7_CIRMR